jgi:hypothetical protein
MTNPGLAGDTPNIDSELARRFAHFESQKLALARDAQQIGSAIVCNWVV